MKCKTQVNEEGLMKKEFTFILNILRWLLDMPVKQAGVYIGLEFNEAVKEIK